MAPTRPAYQLARSSSFENAVPSLPPFLLAPRPRKRSSVVEPIIAAIEPIVGHTLTSAIASASRIASKKLDKFHKDCAWHFVFWLLNPNAFLLLLFWPGWIVVVFAYFWWCR